MTPISSKGTPRAAANSSRRTTSRASASSPGAVNSSTDPSSIVSPSGGSKRLFSQAREAHRNRDRFERGEERFPGVQPLDAVARCPGRERGRSQPPGLGSRDEPDGPGAGDGGQQISLHRSQLEIVHDEQLHFLEPPHVADAPGGGLGDRHGIGHAAVHEIDELPVQLRHAAQPLGVFGRAVGPSRLRLNPRRVETGQTQLGEGAA